MIVQISTDKTLDWNEKNQEYFVTQISEDFKRHESQISRIEVHLKDENGTKDGINDKSCVMEVRIEGRRPIAASDKAATVKLAIAGATDKAKASIKTILGRIQNH